MDVAQSAVDAYRESLTTAEVYTADGNLYKGLPGEYQIHKISNH